MDINMHSSELRCLLANDCDFLLYGFVNQLSPHFEVIDTFENGKAAVDGVKSRSRDFYNVVILDISMPIMDGIEACRLIKSFYEEDAEARVPKIYALTSEEEPEMIAKMKQAGFDEIF